MNPLKKTEYNKLKRLNLKDLADKVNELTGHKGHKNYMACEHQHTIQLEDDNGNIAKGCKDCGKVINAKFV